MKYTKEEIERARAQLPSAQESTKPYLEIVLEGADKTRRARFERTRLLPHEELIWVLVDVV